MYTRTSSSTARCNLHKRMSVVVVAPILVICCMWRMELSHGFVLRSSYFTTDSNRFSSRLV